MQFRIELDEGYAEINDSGEITNPEYSEFPHGPIDIGQPMIKKYYGPVRGNAIDGVWWPNKRKEAWFIELNTIDELMNLIKKIGRVDIDIDDDGPYLAVFVEPG